MQDFHDFKGIIMHKSTLNQISQVFYLGVCIYFYLNNVSASNQLKYTYLNNTFNMSSTMDH
jgi:hypothetical protein